MGQIVTAINNAVYKHSSPWGTSTTVPALIEALFQILRNIFRSEPHNSEFVWSHSRKWLQKVVMENVRYEDAQYFRNVFPRHTELLPEVGNRRLNAGRPDYSEAVSYTHLTLPTNREV